MLYVHRLNCTFDFTSWDWWEIRVKCERKSQRITKVVMTVDDNPVSSYWKKKPLQLWTTEAQ